MIHYINKQYITIGKDSGINLCGHLTAFENARITIGNNVQIGPYIVINAGDHFYKDPNVKIMDQGLTIAPVVIEDDVYIGSNVTILKGVTIPKGAVIGACSLVRSSDKLESYCVYGGNPLRKIGKRE